ncbi:DUF4959 domain-containing protein [Niabella defluvii]|nr:DUF4959 domain-containing protein [Niabella sp. I65]
MKNKLIIVTAIFTLLFSRCGKGDRFETSDGDSTPPGKVTLRQYKPLFGGARFFYTVPKDEDLLGVEAVYTNKNKQSFTFMSSYFVDSLDVYGFGSMDEYTVQLYAVDRSGNKSDPLDVKVTPLEPAYTRVAKTLQAKAGFSSFFLDWQNELKQNINVYVEYEFNQGGGHESLPAYFHPTCLQTGGLSIT